MRVMVSVAILALALAAPAPSQTLRGDLTTLARIISDELASVENTENIDGQRFTSQALDAFVDCSSLKILVKATGSGSKLVYDIPLDRVTIAGRTSDWPPAGTWDDENLFFTCANQSACVQISSPDKKIQWNGLNSLRAKMVGFAVMDGQVLYTDIQHLRAFQRVCRSLRRR